MLHPWQQHLKLGLVHFMAYPVLDGRGPVLESLTALAGDADFELLEITWIQDPAVREQARQLLLTSGLELKYGAQPRLLTQKLDLNSLDAAVRARAVAEIKRAIDDAADFAIRDVGLLSGPCPGEANKQPAMDALTRSLEELCAYAGRRDMSLTLEVFDQAVDKKCLIGPAADARALAERVRQKHANFGLLVDLSHIPLLGETPEQALRPVAEHLTHVHLGNCYLADPSDPAYGDQHPRFGYPGSANDVQQIAAFLRVLFEIGYLQADGSARPGVSFELKPRPGETPEVVIANGKRKLQQAWAKLDVPTVVNEA